MRRLLGLVFVPLAATLLVALSAGQALATTVHCGDVITQDTTVDNDLSGCSDGTALSVSGGGNVTLDLNHHTISGDGQNGITIGRSITDPSGTLTVRDGTVSGFNTGVSVCGKTTDAYVTRVTATGNGYGFEAIRGTVVFEQNLALGNLLDGFFASSDCCSSVGATFTKNRAYSNGQLGINARNKRDGGNNHAHKNGDPRQCVGVVCKP
jgi:hypothetical protein